MTQPSAVIVTPDMLVGAQIRGDKYKWSFRLTAINVTNKVALYNFTSTFSGTQCGSNWREDLEPWMEEQETQRLDE